MNEKTKTILFLLGATAATPFARAAESRAIELQSFRSHSRLAFRVDEGVGVEWKEKDRAFEIVFKGIGLGDWGAPVGVEEEWIRRAKEGLSDSRLERLELEEVPGGVRVSGTWKFPTGESAPALPRMERFDFREKSPPRYIVDFWPRTGPTVAEVDLARQRAERDAAFRKAESEARERRVRRIASEKARAEAEDVTSFCRQRLSEAHDVFLPFRPTHENVSLSRWLSATTPDSNYVYFEPQTQARDAQYVRLALSLYKRGRPALVLRTLEFLEKEHPKTQFATEMSFLKANVLVKLGLEKEAGRLLRELMVVAKGSPVALHSGMYIAARAFAREEHLAAVEGFMWLITHHPEHKLRWVFHLAAAESLYFLRQTDRAAKEYQWVMVHGPGPAEQVEAAARMGDLYLDRHQYERALAAYFQAMNRYPSETKRYPTLWVNRAETLYWLGQADRAEKEFLAFLDSNPSHPEGWRATFRLGEIHGRKDGDASAAEARRWFTETVNRYPYGPGATLARSRLLPCGDHGGFDFTAAERFFGAEAEKFDGAGTVPMERYREFRALARLRTLISLGREDLAIDVGIRALRASATSASGEIVGDLLRVLFRKTLLAMLREGKKYEALALYSEKASAIPHSRRDESPEEIEYLLQLSRAAGDLGLGGLSIQLSQGHAKSYGRIQGRAIAAKGEDVEARIKDSDRRFTEARALWLSRAVEPTAEARADEERRIRSLLADVSSESEHSCDREILLGLLEERAGRHAVALQHAARAQVLLPDGRRRELARITYWLATLQKNTGDFRAAVAGLRRLSQADAPAGGDEPSGLLGVPAVADRATLILREGEILAGLGSWGEAAAAYSRAVEKGIGGNHAAYEYARALSQTGRRDDAKKATLVFEKIAASGQDDFWKKLARDALAGERTREPRGSPTNAKEGGT